ncbi:MAG: L-aspartate oxidase [Clostridia bacterium]|nr:L-aspartate oxidase [Clostridia bacterium]
MEHAQLQLNAKYDVVIVGAGVAGLSLALHLPEDCRALVICKGGLEESDSFLAQGGICVLHDKNDFRSYYEDTMRAGHFENNPATVKCMIEHSRETIDELLSLGVRFAMENGALAYTREGAHSRPRIVFHEDCTGKEITSHLLAHALKRTNLTVRPYTTMLDILTDNGSCCGVVLKDNKSGEIFPVRAGNTVLATGGVGGLFRHSTNFRILTGDGLAVSLRHGVAVDHADYIQFHPTTLYTKGRGRRFLLSESLRGEGAHLINKKGERFVDELLPRDVVTEAIYREMQKEGSDFVRIDLRPVGEETLLSHFPTIVNRCKKEGYDALKDPVPVLPSQHYFMGGVRSDLFGRTTMPHLYAVGETCCNGVHGRNRLASNSLLEAIIFAKRAAEDIAKGTSAEGEPQFNAELYSDRRYMKNNRQTVLKEINRENK